jgi:hypothetical protein
MFAPDHAEAEGDSERLMIPCQFEMCGEQKQEQRQPAIDYI